MKLTEDQINKVMELAGATRAQVLEVAGYTPELGPWLRWGIVKTWSCSRAITCLGPVRKIYWALVCVTTTIPV